MLSNRHRVPHDKPSKKASPSFLPSLPPPSRSGILRGSSDKPSGENKKSGQLIRIVRFGSGRRTRTSDLRVMSPTSCQLLHPAIYLPCPLPTVFPKPGRHFSKTADLIGLLDRFSTAGLIGTLYRLCVCKDKSKKSLLQIIFSVRSVETG